MSESSVIDQIVNILLRIAIEIDVINGISYCWSMNAVAASLTPNPPGIVDTMPAVPDIRKIIIEPANEIDWSESIAINKKSIIDSVAQKNMLKIKAFVIEIIYLILNLRKYESKKRLI